MNVWLASAAALLTLSLACGIKGSRGSPLDRLVSLELAGALHVLALLLLAQGFDRDVYFVTAVALAVGSFVGSLILVHFFESEL